MSGWKSVRARLSSHQAKRCYYCHLRMGPPGSGQLREETLDHLVPQSLGGRTEPNNVVAACRVCNEAKADMLPDEFMVVLAAFKQELAA